jgi:hypothetical protein
LANVDIPPDSPPAQFKLAHATIRQHHFEHEVVPQK